MGGFPLASALVKRADTGASGMPLINGTQTFLTYTAPSDGNLHIVVFVFTLVVTTATETGGQVNQTITDANGTLPKAIAGGGLAVGIYGMVAIANAGVMLGGGTATITQASALTAGGPSTLFAQIWSS